MCGGIKLYKVADVLGGVGDASFVLLCFLIPSKNKKRAIPDMDTGTF